MSRGRKRHDEAATTRQCREIIEAIVKMCGDPNADKRDVVVGFTRDWGGNSLTLMLDGGHTHVGDPDDEFWMLVEDLHAMLTRRAGLSIVPDQGSEAGVP